MGDIYFNAGDGIEAGDGILSCFSISCKGILKFSYQLFAGCCIWKNIEENDMLIECGKLDTDGKIMHGKLIELGLPTKK